MITVIVNNYNYADYIGACISSVLSQTYRNLQLLVVDDGSTDSSLECINKFNDPRIKVVAKKNCGQLSCFNAAIPYIKGEIVTFLDADDLYEKEYLEEILSIYKTHNVDFVFTNFSRFGSCQQKGVSPDVDILVPVSRILTYLSKSWIGGPTSTLSMKASLLCQILPLVDIEPEWRIRADDILIWGASLCNARKFYYHKQLVRYRTHQHNNFYNKQPTSQELEKRQASIYRFFDKFKVLQQEISVLSICREMIQSKLPIHYYLPYLINSRFYFRVMQRILRIIRVKTSPSDLKIY